MLGKQSMQEKSPHILRGVPKPLSILEKHQLAAQEQPARPQIAVFITHGMGQQVPFETIDSATEGLVQAAARKGCPVSSIRARTIQIDGIKTQRTEFDMRDVKGRDVEVHVYEGYWAPITEGNATLRDVMSFLYSAGFKGLLNCRLPFERWIFGGVTSFDRQIGAASRLLLILAVLLSLVVLNAITAIVSGDKFIHLNNTPYFSDSVFASMTTVVGIYLLSCIMFGSALFTLMKCKGQIKHPNKNLMWRFVNKVTQFLMWLWVVSTIISTIVLLLLAAKFLQPEKFSSECISKLWLLIWVVLLLVSRIIQKLLIQFMGDVAAYIDSHSLDRFSDIRTRIKARVFEQAKAVYSSEQYEQIAMVGHSLGSVITYDTLNALINYDELNGNPLNSVNRTKLLLTFGSPLDKTAFIFSSQKGETTATREALAATLQPLIQAYDPYRNINWINVYSPLDIISGKLDFYDDPKASGYNKKRKVHNVIDEDALIPLAAHVEYWNNTTLFDQLYANL